MNDSKPIKVHYFILSLFLLFNAGISVRYFLKRRGKMPHFDTAFSGMASGRKLTKTELVRAIRYMIAAEYEAVQLYMQLTPRSRFNAN